MGTLQKFFRNVFGKKDTKKNVSETPKGTTISEKKATRQIKSSKSGGYLFKGSNNRKHTKGRLKRIKPHSSISSLGNPIYFPKRTKLKGYQKCG